MQDYTIGEIYTLPSLGKVYTGPIDPQVKIRSMTTEEEMKRVATMDTQYKNLSEIIDDCLIEGPVISSYDMCIGDYQFLLHKLRIVTYGAEYPITNTCVYCGCETHDTINLEDLPIISYTEDYETLREFELPKSKTHIRLRPQTPRMLDIIINKTKEYRRKSQNSGFDPSLMYTIAELIETIDGKAPNPVKVEEWIRGLPMADTNVIMQHATKMNEAIGINTDLTCICNVCGLSFKTALKTTSEFFRPTLNL